MTKPKKFSSAQAIEIITDLAHDLSSAFVGGFTLSQDDAWQCAAALGQLLAEHSAAFPARREVSVEEVARCLDDWSTQPGDLAPPYRWKNRQAEATAVLALFSPREAEVKADD